MVGPEPGPIMVSIRVEATVDFILEDEEANFFLKKDICNYLVFIFSILFFDV